MFKLIRVGFSLLMLGGMASLLACNETGAIKAQQTVATIEVSLTAATTLLDAYSQLPECGTIQGDRSGACHDASIVRAGQIAAHDAFSAVLKAEDVVRNTAATDNMLALAISTAQASVLSYTNITEAMRQTMTAKRSP
jgi:hypothetical protein